MVILINGIINTGKSTCARLLADRLKQPTIVEADTFFNFMVMSRDREEKQRQLLAYAPICWENAVLTIHNLVQHGFDVIVPYSLYKTDYELLLDAFRHSDVPLFLITLDTSMEEVLGRRSKREDKTWEKGFAAWQKSIGISHPSAGTIINNTALTPKETEELIWKAIQENEARIQPIQSHLQR